MKNYFVNIQIKIFKSLLFSGVGYGLLFMMLTLNLQAQNTQTYEESGEYTYTVPEGVYALKIKAWGAGGGGGTREYKIQAGSRGGAGGGGGGAFSYQLIYVNPGQEITIEVGKGGNADTDGGNTAVSIGNETYVLAEGGKGAEHDGTAKGEGGKAANGIGEIKYNGGDGANGEIGSSSATTYSGGGGASANYEEDGSDASGINGGAALNEGGSGADGYLNNTNTNRPGEKGSTPGGGGSGGLRRSFNSGTVKGGKGATGQVILTEIEKVADLYTKVDYSITGTSDADSGKEGEEVSFTVKAGNDGPSDVEEAEFTFTVPVGIDIENPESITDSSGSNLLDYDAGTRTFSAKLNLNNGDEISYTFTGELNGALGIKTVESTILRPHDVHDPDATNEDTNIPPTNPHYECFNTPDGQGVVGEISCNNIQEKTFMLLDDCATRYLYYEDFGRTTFDENSGRKRFENEPSISLNPSTGMPTFNDGEAERNGPKGGATSSYLFAPGQDDSGYETANAPHSDNASVARIKNGYYSVNPPGYVKMGIPETDSWHEGTWDPNASTNDPDDPNSNYDWRPAWDEDDADRDISGAVNGAAFHIRGAASASQSIKPFYEFDLNESIQEGETYTLSIYSYVTYHDKDYMIMDVVDKESGFIYASQPLEYPGEELPPEADEEGFSLGWVPLQASFNFANNACDDIESQEVKIVIRGSQDRALETGKGFGHTFIDDVSFVKRDENATEDRCDLGEDKVASIDCANDCYADVEGEYYQWKHEEGDLQNGSIVEESFTQPGTNGGFTLDIYKMDNSFNMKINGVALYEEEIEFQSGDPIVDNYPIILEQNIRFKSDGAQWQANDVEPIWEINEEVDIDSVDRSNNPLPAIRVEIDENGNSKIYGKRTTNSAQLEELELFDPSNDEVEYLNEVNWHTDQENEIEVNQEVVGATAMSVFGYGKDQKDCETLSVEKDGVFEDDNDDGYAQVGETITYTFKVKNAGDMRIHDIEIIDPLFGFNISLDEETHEPIQEGVELSGDDNEDGVLDKNETWTFTVEYKVTDEDVFDNESVYNRAKVNGIGRLTATNIQVEEDSHPTEENQQIEERNPDLPNHTFVPLKRSKLIITNPMIHQRVKK